MKGSDALMEMLRAEGVKYIFGNPGTSEAAIMDSLENYPEFEYILAVQESVAIGMADTYARATGKPAFVSLHIDNGLSNSFALLIDSYNTGTPMVVTAGNKDVRKLAEGRSDLAEMARPYTKWSAEITHPEQYPSVIRRAFNEAASPPTGPVFVSLSANSLDDDADVNLVPSKGFRNSPAANPKDIEDATNILASASSPVMIVGDRVMANGGTDAAVRVAELLGAPVYGHVSSQVNFPTDHPQYMGMLSLRQPSALETLDSADAVLAVGCPVFNDFFYQNDTVLKPETKLVHIDINAGEIGKSEPTDVGVFASPGEALDQLAEALNSEMSGSQMESARGRAAVVGGRDPRHGRGVPKERHVGKQPASHVTGGSDVGSGGRAAGRRCVVRRRDQQPRFAALGGEVQPPWRLLWRKRRLDRMGTWWRVGSETCQPRSTGGRSVRRRDDDDVPARVCGPRSTQRFQPYL